MRPNALPGILGSAVLIPAWIAACACQPEPGGLPDGEASDGALADAGSIECAGPCPASAVKYLVVVIQENHTFENHFGRYCTAATGSNPSCSAGPTCCEAGPATDPSGSSAAVLDDTANGSWSPDHSRACEAGEIDDGGMDKFVSGTACSSPGNFAYADPTTIRPYWTLAGQYAIDDRYFQSVVGASSANDVFLARAGWEFDDNAFGPQNAIGTFCNAYPQYATFPVPTIGDLLVQRGIPWTFFAEGYAAMADVATDGGVCPRPPADCPSGVSTYPCTYDPGDDPFLYDASLRDKPQYMKDLGAFAQVLAAGQLPAVSFVKGIGYKTEHPGAGNALSAGVGFVDGLVTQILASPYAGSVLVLVVWDEGGGYFDHVSPPAPNPNDGQPYGTRLPFLAIGPFTKTNYVSHVRLEHASIVKFIEWNWLGGTGQLGTRDTTANDLGDLLDPSKTGVAVPAD